MTEKAILENITDIEDYFKGRINVQSTEDGDLRIISFKQETLENELLSELLHNGLTLRSVDNYFRYEDDEGVSYPCTLWVFAPMNITFL